METNGKATWLDTPAGQHLQESLSNEKILRGLDHLLNRIDTLEKAVENLTTIMNQGPGMISMATDIADEAYKNAAANGVDIEQRIGSALHLAEKLTAPKMVQKLDNLFQFAEKVPGLISMAVDSFDEHMAAMNQSAMDVQKLIDMGRDASLAVAKAKELPEAKVGGFFSMLRTMRDPDRQRAIGFMMNIAKAYGQQMKDQS